MKPAATRLLFLAAVTALPLGVLAADATPHDAGKDLPSFETLDADHNGIITLPEITVHPPAMAAHLKRCDTNHDQQLTHDEYDTCVAGHAAGKRPAHSGS